jgi:uncharacterized membrane protein (Fun14 family)
MWFMSFLDKVKEKMAMYKMRILAVATVSLIGLVQYAQAAVNFTPIAELITAVTELIPSLMELIIALAPLIVTMSIIGFLVVFFRKNILDMLNF